MGIRGQRAGSRNSWGARGVLGLLGTLVLPLLLTPVLVLLLLVPPVLTASTSPTSTYRGGGTSSTQLHVLLKHLLLHEKVILNKLHGHLICFLFVNLCSFEIFWSNFGIILVFMNNQRRSVARAPGAPWRPALLPHYRQHGNVT